jgi:hypothetical protein
MIFNAAIHEWSMAALDVALIATSGFYIARLAGGRPRAANLLQRYGLIVMVITIAICVHTGTCDSSFNASFSCSCRAWWL